ncbi:hypothetical protein BCR33DRAFT_849033 [Rhizoclosmatium globosum]|uniref:C2H2-type domain-containing protein n=1 Tax=Rhizoclosmatium globosum TaxID=329046 RepID=A0A1Y2CJ27_9FUNG|nr:hypothetical protein BCR33DRAFT_849033 [Rhizoclosmatium globosum]|eukprot:ORY47032.1 hypothetical protein BCR33DRAFT_849033 [Rhizoclosmatium globosum]
MSQQSQQRRSVRRPKPYTSSPSAQASHLLPGNWEYRDIAASSESLGSTHTVASETQQQYSQRNDDGDQQMMVEDEHHEKSPRQFSQPQWTETDNSYFDCLKCGQIFQSKSDLLAHFEGNPEHGMLPYNEPTKPQLPSISSLLLIENQNLVESRHLPGITLSSPADCPLGSITLPRFSDIPLLGANSAKQSPIQSRTMPISPLASESNTFHIQFERITPPSHLENAFSQSATLSRPLKDFKRSIDNSTESTYPSQTTLPGSSRSKINVQNSRFQNNQEISSNASEDGLSSYPSDESRLSSTPSSAASTLLRKRASPERSSSGRSAATLICQICQKKFTRSDNLKTHMRIHSGDKPYICRFCPQTFSQSSTLVKHERTHTGERPYACPACPARFTQPVHLKNHVKTHKEKPFKCSECVRMFVNPVELKAHLLGHGISISVDEIRPVNFRIETGVYGDDSAESE